MIPILIIGSTEEERQKRAYEIAAEAMEVNLDKLESYPDFFLIAPNPSITIAQVRTLIGNLSRKPFQSPISTAILLEASLATIDAQNALLKTLEEPFPSAQIILTSPNKDLLLSTVVSRCREIALKSQDKPKIDYPDHKTTDELITFFLDNAPEERLKKLDQIALGKQETLVELENYIKVAEEQLLKSNDLTRQKLLTALIRHADQTRKYITSNANVRLALAHFLLSF